MKICSWCKKALTKKQKKFCSIRCYGLSRRGSGKSHIRIRVNGKREYLHRWKVEQRIRKLEPDEIVHHIDENKHNNSLQNFEILSGRAAHLHAHNYYRHRRNQRQQTAEDWQDYGW
jgi:hypothetical protein